MQMDESTALPAPEFHRAPVLILEDDEETANELESFLRNSEFQPILASTVAQAEVWTARHMPTAVVADIFIGDDQSWAFIGRLHERLPELPLIVTSVHNDPAMAVARGASLLLAKPVEQEVLLRELRRLTAGTGTRRLLLVDDNEVARYILRDLLNQPWLDIREATNGSDALKSMNESLPDAVILDLLMPDMSGFETLRQLRAQPATESLPVLIYTSKVLSDVEKTQLDSLHTRVIRKEDVTTRLSAQPFLDWVKSVGLAP
jgi:CheY-like chemotaxis protein